jgi:diguanylate cyclase (GGDEF)-like protein
LYRISPWATPAFGTNPVQGHAFSSSQMTSEAAASPLRSGVTSRVLATGILGTYALVLVIGVLFWQTGPAIALLTGVRLIAELAALTLCVLAGRTLSGLTRRMWIFFAAAAATSFLSHLAELLPKALQLPSVHYFWLASYALLLIGLIVGVHSRERGRLTEVALDVALIITAASLVIVRLAPGARTAITSTSDSAIFLVMFAPVVALSALFMVAVIVTDARGTHDARIAYGIAGGIVCLVLTTLPHILGGRACCGAGSWTLLPAIGIWVLLTYSAAQAWQSGEPEMRDGGGTARLRQFVAPTVALVLASISIHGALGAPFGRKSALVLGVLGALVALRLNELLNATRTQVTERRELAQTRALVEVSRALAGKNDLDATLRIVTQWAVRVLNARAASVEMLSADATTLVLRAAEGMPPEAIGMSFPVDKSFTGWVIVNGEPRVSANPSKDPFITADGLKFIGNSPIAAMPMRYRERLLGVLTCVGNQPFDSADLDLLRAFANQTALAVEDARLFEQVRALSVTDPLTGLANRRQLDREMVREFAAAKRGRQLVAVMFDLDSFKQHNDKYGHVAGDEALRHFAEALNTTTRTMNLAARYGGDEFFALLADADERGADIFITRVKDRFYRTMDSAGWPQLKVSAGMASYTPDMETPEDLIMAADRALYIAKFETGIRA